MNLNHQRTAPQKKDVEQHNNTQPLTKADDHAPILNLLAGLYTELFNHDGFGNITIEMRILRRGQKEIIVHCGKQYRFVVDCKQALASESALKHLLKRDLLT